MRLKKLSLIFFSAILSTLSVILFYKTGLGINFPIFNVLLIGVIIGAAVIFKRLNTSIIVNSILLVFLSIPFALTTSDPVRVTLLFSWLYFLNLTFYTLVQTNTDFEFWRYLASPIEQGVMAFISPFLPLSKLPKSAAKSAKSTYLLTVLRVGIGIIIAIPFLILFLALLISADLAFRELFVDIFSTNFLKDTINIVLWIAITFWIGFGILYYNLFKKEKFIPKEVKGKKNTSRFFIESVTVLSLVELLFLIFNVVQITYLFGGERLVTGGDFTYSEYARRGFFELVVVSIIALFLIATLFKIKKTKTNIQEIVIRVLGLFGLLELVPVAVSAFYKLYLYEDEYGFTRLRVYSHLFIIFLLIVFIWFAVKFLSKVNESVFLYGLELITIGSLIVVGFINVDAAIARFNIDRYKTDLTDEAEIDLEYLHTLSYDSVPKLIEFFKENGGEVQKEVAFYLKEKYDALLFETKREGFREFNFREISAKKVLEENLDEIELYAGNFEEGIKREYDRNLGESVESLDDDLCIDGAELTYINQNAIKLYFSSLEVYLFDNPKHKVTSKSSYNCYDLESGKYFVAVKDYDFLGSLNEEVFLVEVEEQEKNIVLVSRKG